MHTKIPQIPRNPSKRRQVPPYLAILALEWAPLGVCGRGLPQLGEEVEQVGLMWGRGAPDGLEEGVEGVPEKVAD
jgi:hypothetical protein